MQGKYPQKLPNNSIIIDLTGDSDSSSTLPKKRLAELKKEEKPQEKKFKLSNEPSKALLSFNINNAHTFQFVPEVIYLNKPNKMVPLPSLFFSWKINEGMELQELAKQEKPLNVSFSQDIVQPEPPTATSLMKLSIELVPQTSWVNNVRTEVSKNNWKKLQKATLSKQFRNVLFLAR